jgi:putative Mn2+ efflux pump MntP
MGIIEIIIIAIVEAMDCFAVAIATGLSKKESSTAAPCSRRLASEYSRAA